MTVTKQCNKCKKIKPISEFYPTYYNNKPRYICKECSNKQAIEWRQKNREHVRELERIRRYKNGENLPMSKNKDCSSFLGVHIAENLLEQYFNNVIAMPYGNPGYDFICSNNYKIDVKSACCSYNPTTHWKFSIRYNDIPDYFLLLAFDNRTNLNLLHMWIFPRHELYKKSSITISENCLHKWDHYEKSIHELLKCYNNIKSQ
jgi:hypothetical protein